MVKNCTRHQAQPVLRKFGRHWGRRSIKPGGDEAFKHLQLACNQLDESTNYISKRPKEIDVYEIEAHTQELGGEWQFSTNQRGE
jgi:hypothetical protein